MTLARLRTTPRILFGGFVACLTPLFMSLWAGPAMAADGMRGIELTPFVGYRLGGSFEDRDTEEDYDLDDDSSAGVIFNFPASDFTEWEIYYSKQSTDVDVAGFADTDAQIDVDIEYLQVGGTYLFDRTQKAQPYFVATAGVTKIDPDAAGTSSDTFFSFGVGGGWKFFPNSHVGLRLDGRLIGTLISSDSEIFCKSDSEGGACAVALKGESLYQFEFQAGVVFRF
jgi:opacity protein-like surface antigen